METSKTKEQIEWKEKRKQRHVIEKVNHEEVNNFHNVSHLAGEKISGLNFFFFGNPNWVSFIKNNRNDKKFCIYRIDSI